MVYNKEKLKSVFIILIGTIFVVYGLILCIMSNLNIGVVLVLALGIFMLCMGTLFKKPGHFQDKKFFKVCKAIFIIFLCAELILISFIAIYGVSDSIDYCENAVIVLGAGIHGDKVTLPLKLRLDKAVDYHYKNPEALIVVTGGRGFQETVTEAYAMEKYLIKSGVDKNKILKEEKATSTSENMKLSKVILDNCFAENYSVAVITNNFHVFRASVIARQAGFQRVAHMHAGLQWYNFMPCFLRESLAVIKLLILG